MIRLDVLVELLVLVVRTIVRVFLQLCMACLEKRCVLMIRVICLTICWCCWRFLDVVGGDWCGGC